jgi:hypothetical protein
MVLPIVETPTYELTLPSQDIKVQFRPFLVKEEKILLIALESNNDNEIVKATKQILNACTFEKLDINSLPLFDIEYIFLQIRAKSIGEIAKFRILCPDDKKTLVNVELDLTKVEVNVDDEHVNKIFLDDKKQLGVILKYPTLDITKAGYNMSTENMESVFKIIGSCIECVFEGEKIYPAKDSTQQELQEFLESLSQQAFEKIKKFFDTMPQLRHEIEIENPNTKVKSKVVLQGLRDFFQSASPIIA